MNHVGIREARGEGASLGLRVSASRGSVLWELTTAPEGSSA